MRGSYTSAMFHICAETNRIGLFKVKGKTIPVKHHTMKTFGRVEVHMVPSVLNLGSRWREVVSFTLRPL
jgi:hypothetical protein